MEAQIGEAKPKAGKKMRLFFLNLGKLIVCEGYIPRPSGAK
jgi:hypothetical protein